MKESHSFDFKWLNWFGEFWLSGLFPAILNLASNAHISTNATCGEKGPEMYCKLVEHVPGRPVRNAQCRICDGNSAHPKGKWCCFSWEAPLGMGTFWNDDCGFLLGSMNIVFTFTAIHFHQHRSLEAKRFKPNTERNDVFIFFQQNAIQYWMQ